MPILGMSTFKTRISYEQKTADKVDHKNFSEGWSRSKAKDEGGASPVSATVETNTSSDPPKLSNEEKSRDADVDSRSTKLLKTRPWENSRQGWIVNPQRPTGKFYNSIMPDFYRSFWPFYPDEKLLGVHLSLKGNDNGTCYKILKP